MQTLTLKTRIITLPYFIRAILIHGIFAVLKIGFVLFGGASLFFEEAQYWLWSQYPDLSYYSKPPLIAYVNLVSTDLFGTTELAIRLNAILCGFLIAVVVYLLTLKVTNNAHKAFWSSVLLMAFPYFWIISYFFTTDSLVTLFWIWAVYSFYMVVNNRPDFWIWTGLAVGLGFLSKYVMVFFWPLALLYLVIYRPREFRKPYVYLSILLSLVFTIPVLYWNSQHAWVSVQHVLALAMGQESGGPAVGFIERLGYMVEYLGGQLFSWLLLFPLLLLTGFGRLLRGRADKRDVLVLFPVLVITLFFGLLSFFSRIEMNWTFFVLPAVVVYAARHVQQSELMLRRRIVAVGILMIFMLALPLLGRYFNYPASLNPMKRIMGWEQMTSEIVSVISPFEGEVMIVADSYKTASMLSFYLPGNPQVHDYSPNQRMNQFDIWQNDIRPDNKITTIYVGERIPDQKAFGNILMDKEVVRPYNDNDVRTYLVIVYDAFYGMYGERKERY